jgi:hypothetical protein
MEMARLVDLQGQIQLDLRILRKEYDPFQLDLEWFHYELAVTPGLSSERRLPMGAPTSKPDSRLGNRAVTGRINRKDVSILLSNLDDLILRGQDLRYEPYDLNFYLEWKIETPHVYSIVIWFDMALTPRDLQARFPSAHTGFRFLADEDSLAAFRSAVEMEFLGEAPQGREEPSGLIN